MAKDEGDWSTLIAGVIGAAAGAGAAAATLNGQIKTLQSALIQWQRQAARLQTERDEQTGRATFAESQLRVLREAESKLRVEVAELKRRLDDLSKKK